MRASFLSLIAFFFLIFGAYAKGPGSTSGTTLVMPVFPQAAGMAEACSSLSGRLMLISYNPAGLAEFTGTEVAALHNRGMAEDRTSAIVLGKRFSFASFATAVIHYTTGEIELYDSIGDARKKIGQEDILDGRDRQEGAEGYGGQEEGGGGFVFGLGCGLGLVILPFFFFLPFLGQRWFQLDSA